MQSVGTANTSPELILRRALHSRGFRYRLHRKGLPGRPDIVFPSRKVAVFVHGCFWHGHGCRWGKLPKSRLGYWKPKIESNRARDARNLRELRALGWRTCVVWQCELKESNDATSRVERLLCSRDPSR